MEDKNKSKNFIKEYLKYCTTHNLKNIRNMAFIILFVFVIYFILSLLVADILPEKLKRYYYYVYTLLIFLSLVYLGATYFFKKKQDFTLLRYANVIIMFLFSHSLIALSILDHINTNEITAFIITIIIIAFLYRENNYILVGLLSICGLSMIFGMLYHSKIQIYQHHNLQQIHQVRFIDISVYIVISIALAVINNRNHKHHYRTSIDLEEKKKEFEVMSFRDSLTDLFNRRYLFHALENEKNRCLRYQTPFSILLIDMDHFKKINDTHGHLAGDSVLVEFSNIAMNECRGEDIVARYGGEEFMIILIGAKVENAISVAERLRKIVEDYNFKGMSEPVTVSIGVAEFYGNKEIDDLIQQADKNLYTAKNKGRNRVE